MTVEDFQSAINDKWILSQRGEKNKVDPYKPYGWIVEKERLNSGEIEEVGTIFLTNSECPFHCLMCDLWKNTTNTPAPSGAIPDQIRLALGQMPAIRHLKLYNSGSFFDPRAIPPEDYSAIAAILDGFETVIVESHPQFIGKRTLDLSDKLHGRLQVALGLETVNPSILNLLNKKMDLKAFEKSISFLSQNNILSRAFILLKSPFLTEEEAIYWAERSLDFAFSTGVECCTIIPVRQGNGAMDELLKKGYFQLPEIHSLEQVLEYGIHLNAGRVFADTWDLELFSKCVKCFDSRLKRIESMNLSQKILKQIRCSCSSNSLNTNYTN
jgi:radical SAM enzyme (TIGR01210 family)